jgi:molybdenum cofactor cytidylyltransferase
VPSAGLILAAGAATRMGQLKQLLPYRGATLVEHAVKQALAAELDPLIVVIGAQAPLLRSALAAQPVTIVENTNWASGMGSSIAAGVQFLAALHSQSAALAILLADQPRVEAGHLHGMQALLDKSRADIIAAEYAGTLGVPAFFQASLFPTLAALDPAAGARSILHDARWRVEPFSLPEAAFDIDTPADFDALNATV